MTDTNRDAVEQQLEQAEAAAIHLPLSKPIIGRLCATSRALLAAKEAAEAEQDENWQKYVDANEARIDAEAREREAAALREKLRAKIKALHEQLPYFGVSHIREGLEDMLDVIGPMEGDKDE